MQSKTKVLITGGGITGLSAALFLLQQGITPLLIERHRSTSIHPRARGFDIRTMELFRELKLNQAIREAGKALGPAWGILRGTNLFDTIKDTDPKTLTITFPSQLAGMEKLAALTPEPGSRCTQDLSEPLLLSAARDRGGDIRFYHELVSYTQNSLGVTAIIRNRSNGETETITADYLIAADGAKSPIRENLMAHTTGQGVLADFLNIYFEADLTELVRGREFSLFLIQEPDLTGFLTSINNSDHWVFQLRYYPEQGKTPDSFSEEQLVTILKTAIGLPELPVRIISMLPWQMTVKVADQMQYGRVFLAGDAAHTMTPYGGKGANAGIQDVHNLAWKLAAVIKEQASPGLLGSYNAERQPIGSFYALRSGEMADEHGLVMESMIMKNMKAFIGIPDFTYASSAIIGGVSSNIPEEGAPVLCGKPGSRIPHIWLDEEKKQSTLDLIQGNFLLAVTGEGKEWIAAAKTVSDKYGIPLSVFHFIADQGLTWKEATAMEEGEAILVRPDGFIAWRSEGNDFTTLEKAFVKILSGTC